MKNQSAIITPEQSIEQIKAALENAEKHLKGNSSYETGILGLSLFYCYYALYTDDKEYFSLAEKYLLLGLDLSYLKSFKKVYTSDSIDGHISNLGRFLEFCKKNHFLDIDTNSYLKDLDETMSQLMVSKITIGDFDLNSGAFAAAYYFLSRISSLDSLKENFIPLLEGLEEKALKDAEGDYYWKSPSLYNNIYLGLSHGSAMVISLLATLWDKGIAASTCERIIRKATNFVMKQKRKQVYGIFPLVIEDPVKVKPFSPCYGDIGVGFALCKTINILNNPVLDITVREIIDSSISRCYDADLSPYPPDAAIIYGAAGLASLFEKLAQIYGDQRLPEASQYWSREICNYAQHENEFAGYSCMFTATDKLWNFSFGWGIIGIGISLMRYVKPELPPFSDLQMIA